MGTGAVKFLVIFLIVGPNLFERVTCDGDHEHSHVHTDAESQADSSAATKTTSSNFGSGTVTTTHTSSGDSSTGGHEAFSSILSSLNPSLVNSLASNPQVVQALNAYGINPSAAAAAAASSAGGPVGVGGYDYPKGGYDYPPPPATPQIPGIPNIPGFGGFPGLPFPGLFKNLQVSGSYGLFFPVIEKIIVIVGGGILILLLLALLTKGLAKGGMFYNWGSSISEALAGSASVDIGPIHKSVAGSAALNAGGNRPFQPTPSNLQMQQRVFDGIDQQF